MKKTLTSFTVALAIAVSAAAALSSCNAVKDAIPAQTVSFDGASADVIIPPTADTTAKADLATVSFRYNLDSMIRSQTSGALGAGNIQSVKVTSVKLVLSDADQNNSFGNFEYAGLVFNTDATPGSLPYNVALVEHNPSAFNSTLVLPLLSPDQDIRQYFGSNVQLTYLLVSRLRHAITKTLHCHIDIKYDIQVKL